MELSTIINVEPSSLHKYLCLRVDVARLASKLSNGGSLDHSYVVPDKVLDTFEDYGEKVRVLERHRNYLRSCLEEEQEQRRDDSKSCLEDKSCAVGHDLKKNQNTTGLLESLRDELQNSRPNCVQDQTQDFGQESRPSQIVGHDLKKNQNTTGLPGSLRDETRESRPDCVQIDVEDLEVDFGQESRPSQIVGHDLKKNQNTTGLPGSLRDETRESRPDCVQIDVEEIEVVAEPSNIRPLSEGCRLLDIPAGWTLPRDRNHQDGHRVTIQYVFTWSVRLCRKLKQALSLRQIGHKFSESHGFARPSWFKNVLHEHTYMHIQDIWRAADVSPDENRPCIIKMKRNMNKTVASQLPDGHEEDDQEGPAHKKLRRTNVKQTFTFAALTLAEPYVRVLTSCVKGNTALT